MRRKRLSLFFTIIFLVIAYLWITVSSCETSKVPQIIALGPVIIGIAALSAYLKNSSIERMKFIDKVYKKFDAPDIAELHDKLIEDKDGNLKFVPSLPHLKDELALIRALTLFDQILNYYEQDIINNETLSYIAAEILDFYNHRGVIAYIEDIHKKYEYAEKRYIDDIKFYSGLLDLGPKCEKKYLEPTNKFLRFWKRIF